jgi:hypothetical protein
VKAETACTIIRPELSALLDDELDVTTKNAVEDHVGSCDACRAELERLDRTRRFLRARPAEGVPDFATEIEARIRNEGKQRPTEWKTLARIASIAAVIAAVVVATTWPREDRPATVASASEISAELQSAAKVLDAYRAQYSIVERGDPSAPVKRLQASIAYAAPESFRLEVTAPTDGGARASNEYTVVANPRAWSIDEAGSRRVVIHRQPFDQSVSVPTDLILPLDSLADAEAFRVIGREVVAGFDTYRIRLPFGTAAPLISALQPGGEWRPFHPTDQVDIWLASATWFPVQFDVRAGASRDRSMWAAGEGLSDESGDLLLHVQLNDFSEPDSIAREEFRVEQTGIVSDSRFSSQGLDSAGAMVPGLDAPAGLRLYRAGRTGNNGTVVAYSDGMSWLRVSSSPGQGFESVLSRAPEEIDLGQGRWAYYLPASESTQRRLTLMSVDRTVTFEGNVPRARLVDAASDSDVAGTRAPRVFEHANGVKTRFLGDAKAAAFGFASTPRWLPPGYLRSSSTATVGTDATTVTTIYRRSESEFEGSGIRITQTKGVTLLTPSAERSIELSLADGEARWSSVRGELEWISEGVYRAVAVPSAELSIALKVAEGMR